MRKVFLGYSEAEKDFYRESYSQRDLQKKRKDAVAELGLDQTKKLFLYQVEAEGPAASIMPCSM